MQATLGLLLIVGGATLAYLIISGRLAIGSQSTTTPVASVAPTEQGSEVKPDANTSTSQKTVIAPTHGTVKVS